MGEPVALHELAGLLDECASSDMDETEHLLRSRSGSVNCCVAASRCVCNAVFSMLRCLFGACVGEREYRARVVRVGRPCCERFPPNVVKNQKYNIITFLPMVLFVQFSVFLNLFFLIMAMSQFIPELRVGSLLTYWSPLAFVVSITVVREAVDEMRRYRRDKELNDAVYTKLTAVGPQSVSSSSIRVGDIIQLEKNQRVPADMVLLRTTESSGSCFVRTDQLDGETDWKLRVAVGWSQKLAAPQLLFSSDADVYAEKPQRNIHTFIGTVTQGGSVDCGEDGGGGGGGGVDSTDSSISLSVENTLWANTVLASGSALGLVVYTGRETRSVMNNSRARSKMGLLDVEVNNITKILFVFVVVMSSVMMCLKGWNGPWFRYFFRFILLFSYIIPLSVRVNLDLAKVFYSWTMQRDPEMPQTVVRSTNIPEELGRIEYLLTDKTGTLTQNEMLLKKVHIGKCSFSHDSFAEVRSMVKRYFSTDSGGGHADNSGALAAISPPRGAVPSNTRAIVAEAVRAIALCHNVTPMISDERDAERLCVSDTVLYQSGGGQAAVDLHEVCVQAQSPTPADAAAATAAAAPPVVSYQASSPDEVALVNWTEQVGLTLIHRDIERIRLRSPSGLVLEYKILQVFPFTSETKRMGIIVQDINSGVIRMYMKGADTVMSSLVLYNDWLEEESDNMAREGLRTLVVASKQLTVEQYADFEQRYNAAKLSLTDRPAMMAAVLETLERQMELLCLTGVEDKLQRDVRPTLDMLRNAGIKVWMLTGDKLETAICIAHSSRVTPRSQTLHVMADVTTRAEAHHELNAFRRKNDCALVIKGDSLEVVLRYYDVEFMELACVCPAVVVCRCSPTQKACVVQLIQRHTGKRCAAIGDGGNDVSMIQAADCGIGIVGKEGKQASMAADFSITQFCHLARLLFVHGRNSYRRSASISQFVMHRGLIISTMQAIFSSVFYFASVALFQGILVVGYTTIYTNLPILALALDIDVPDRTALTYPELYKELTKGRSLSFKTFFIWVAISIYQGGILMYGAMLLFEDEFINIVTIGFTSLILTELLMVALTIRTWHYLMVVAELFSFGIYALSLFLLRTIFDQHFIQSADFLWKVVVITLVSCVPLYVLKFVSRRFSPPAYSKLS